MTEHTPGPWQHLNGDLIGATVRERTAIIADCCTDSGPQGTQVAPDQRDANARLIAAAPDLLAALEEMLQSVTCHGPDEQVRQLQAEARVTARAAIGKARGQS